MEKIPFKMVKIQKNKYQKKQERREFIIKLVIFIIILFIICLLLVLKVKKIFKKKPKMNNKIDINNNINNNNNIDYNKKLDISNFVTYAQYLEDLILYCVFYDVDNGFYIDVGANDPEYNSVTKTLYLMGWHGINIEPLPDMHQKLSKDRIRDINLNIGASEKEDTLVLRLDGDCSSIIDKKYYGINGNTINITVYPLSKICKEYVPKNEEIQFCKIDVENHEKSALLGFDFQNYRPKVFCIESTKPGSLIPDYQEWEYILFQNGYAFGFEYVVNRFYYDTKVDYLSNRFLNIEKYIKEYNETLKRKSDMHSE